MQLLLSVAEPLLARTSFEVPLVVYNAIQVLKVLLGFSLIIFVHEMGHFLAAKYVGVRIDRFAVGFGYRLCGWRRNEGFTFGNRPNYTAEELADKDYGETDYCFKALPFGGYVKMLGQDDIQIDEKTGEVTMTDDPRAFTNRTVGQRMFIVSAGVVMNLIFGALAFMAVFLIGKPMLAPVIGMVAPDSPADKQGIERGDVVVSIDGKEITSFNDIIIKTVLADGPVDFRIQRDGVLLDKTFTLTPKWSDVMGFRHVGVFAFMTTVLARDGEPIGPDEPNLLKGDKIIRVDDRPVKSDNDVLSAILYGRGGVVTILAERRDPAHPNAPPTRVTVKQRCLLTIESAGLPADDDGPTIPRYVLGMRPRQQVTLVTPRSPAERAGFKLDDVIVRWDGVEDASMADIHESVRSKNGQTIAVDVERGGERLTLEVTPSKRFALFKKTQPEVGLGFGWASSSAPVVADIQPGTPIATLNLPRGSLLQTVGGVSVSNWFDVIDVLKARAGEQVTVAFQTGGRTVRARMTIPSSLVDELRLPPDVIIREIDGQSRITIPVAGASDTGSAAALRLPSTIAVRALLKKSVGRTVRIKYYTIASGRSDEKDFTVTPDNYDPWQLRVKQVYDPTGRFEPLKKTVHAHGNPIKALWLGVDYTWSKLIETYMTIKQLFKRNVGVKNVSGPVGIISHAVDLAKESFVELLFFFAFLSVNLAVINFMPLPVVDGGLMVFLLIEKIKGRPLSIKTQMISTIVGLALIVLCFLFVTIQDIAKFFK